MRRSRRAINSCLVVRYYLHLTIDANVSSSSCDLCDDLTDWHHDDTKLQIEHFKLMHDSECSAVEDVGMSEELSTEGPIAPPV